MRGRFYYELKGARTENGFPRAHIHSVWSPAQASFLSPIAIPPSPSPTLYVRVVGTMAEFVSMLTYSDEQKGAAPNLEPSLEHLLRSALVHESLITTLRVKRDHATPSSTCLILNQH